MKTNHKKVNELAESWINGNKTIVRAAVKRLNKLEFYYLHTAICTLSNEDDERLANNLNGNY